MRTITAQRLATLSLIFTVTASVAWTTEETNQIVHAMLVGACPPPTTCAAGGTNDVFRARHQTWNAFCGRIGNGRGWTVSDKQAAFDWYLSSLGTRDCTALSFAEEWDVAVAIAQCDKLSYTNATPALKALADNPKGVFREEARRLWQKWQPQE